MNIVKAAKHHVPSLSSAPASPSVSARARRLGAVAAVALLVSLAPGCEDAEEDDVDSLQLASYAVRDTSAEHRTIRVSDGSLPVFRISFTAASAGEKRRIRSRVELSHSDDAGADEILMAGVSIFCCPGSDYCSTSTIPDGNKLGHTTNTEQSAGNKILMPRFIYTAPSAGTYTCELRAVCSRARIGAGPVEDQWFFINSSATSEVGQPSYLEATAALDPSAGTGRDLTGAWDDLDNGEAVDVATWNSEFVAPAGISEFAMSGDVALTACTATGGSTDPNGTTHCHPDPAGGLSHVKVNVEALQRASGGGYCATTLVHSRTFDITADEHHHVEYGGGMVPVSSAPGCTRTFRLKAYVKDYSGQAVVVQTNQSLTAAIP